MRKTLTQAIQQLGGTVAADGPEFTHFLTLQAARGHKDRGFKKSLNTLLALAAGASLLALQDSSCAAGAPLTAMMRI